MKRKFIIKITAILIAAAAALCPLCACSGSGKAALSLGKNTLTVGHYSLIASVLKGSLAYGNPNIGTDAYWETVVDGEGKTNEQYFNERTLEIAKEMLYKLALFDEKGLTLPQSVIDKIDEEIEYWIDYDGEGSENKFNEILSAYGANRDILREYMIMSAKVEYLTEYMYGGGDRISDPVKQEYLDENYVCFKQILLPYYRYVYDKDENGDEIYYLEDMKIAYDSEKGDPADSDGDGKYNRDSNDDVIYYEQDKDGNVHICYDKTAGTRKISTDSKGNYITEALNKAECGKVWELAQDVYGKAQKGNFNGFEALAEIYDENADSSGVPIYLNVDVSYSLFSANETVDELKDAVSKLEIGGIAMIESESGMHILMRYEPEDKAWENKEYSGYFNDETGIADFHSALIGKLFSAEIDRIKASAGEVRVETEAIADISIRNIGINYYFY